MKVKVWTSCRNEKIVYRELCLTPWPNFLQTITYPKVLRILELCPNVSGGSLRSLCYMWPPCNHRPKVLFMESQAHKHIWVLRTGLLLALGLNSPPASQLARGVTTVLLQCAFSACVCRGHPRRPHVHHLFLTYKDSWRPQDVGSGTLTLSF